MTNLNRLLRAGAILLIAAYAVSAQTTATWTGGGDGVNYSDATNWDIGVVPINGGTNYNVVIPASTAVTFDVGGGANTIQDLTMGASATLQFDLATNLSVAGTAAIDNARIFSDIGSSALIPVDSYLANVTGTVFSADGAGTLLDLSSMETWTQNNFGGFQRRSIVATGSANIDLSGLTTISNTATDDDLEFRTSSSGTIDLTSLTTVDGPIFFNIEAPTYTLPALESVAGGMTITRSAASTTDLPVLLSNSGGTWNVPAGGAINAPNMTQLRSTVINIDTGGALNAPSLIDIDGSTLNLGASQTYNAGSILTMDNARINLSGGVTLTAAATSYLSDVVGTLFTADGPGTNLDLSSVQTWTQNNFGGFQRRSVVASGGGNVDLSGLTSITNASSDDDIEFRTQSGGTIDLSNLTTVDGPVYMNVDTPNYSLPTLSSVVGGMSIDRPDNSTMTLPALLSNSGGTWNVPQGGSITAPVLTELSNTTVNIGHGGTLNLVNLTNLSGSTVNLGPNQTLNAPVVQNFDNTRINLNGGASFGVAGTSYLADFSGTAFSADGPGTELDLASIQTWTQNNFGGFIRRSVIASGGGHIDLSGLTTINNTSGDDDVEFRIDSGGTISLNSLATVEGPVFFNVDAPTYTLPALASVNGGMTISRSAGSTTNLPVLLTSSGGTWNVPASGSINAASLTQLRNTTINIGTDGALNAASLVDIEGSTLILGADQTFNASSLTNVTHASIQISGGINFGISATSVIADRGGIIYSATGAGTDLDLSSINTWTQNNFGGFVRRTVQASSGGHIDLSGLTTFVNTAGDDDAFFQATSGGTIDMTGITSLDGPVAFDVESGGQITLGTPAITNGQISISVEDLDSQLTVTGDLITGAQTVINVGTGASLAVAGNFSHQATTEANVELSVANVHLNGDGGQFLEVASEDLGVDGSTSGNFGSGQLQVGDTTTATSLNLLDVVDNGNRNGGAEALYLFGLGGPEGLRVAGGSVVVLNGINVYAFDPAEGGQVHLNSLFGPGDFRIPYDDGFLQIAVGDFFWDDASGGSFASDGNWQGGITPLIADNATWDLGTNGYTVAFGSNVATNSAVIRNDTVTFDLAGRSYKTVGAGIPHSLVVGQSTGQNAILTIANGTLLTRSVILAEFSGSSGQLALSNTNAQVSQAVTFGAGAATLELTAGSHMSVGQMIDLGPAGDIALTSGTISVGNSNLVPAANTLKVFSEGTLKGSGDINGDLDIEGLLSAVVNSASDHDTISVTGSLEIDGRIEVALNFQPALGSEIILVAADGVVSGQFIEVTGVDVVVVDRATVVDVTDSNVRLFTTLPGDANLDGNVDGQDFLIWNANKFSDTPGWGNGDFNGDGTVDGADFLTWNSFKFQSIDELASVPEPTFGMLLIVGLFGLSLRRRVESIKAG